MTKHSPIGGRPSLLERAAEVYDFNAALKARAPETAAPFVSSEVETPASTSSLVSTSLDTNGVETGEWKGPLASIDREALREAAFIVPGSHAGALAEEFRIVKRQLLAAAKASPEARRILICSGQPDEGKTFCAVNLALSMAGEKDHEVLLVDADVAKPEILSTLGLEGGPGLIDAIADPGADVERFVIRTDIAGLSVLPAGRHTHEATELIAATRTRVVLDRLAKPNRIILFDSPPALAASPAAALAAHVGQIVLVVRADRTGEADLREAIQLLGGGDKVQLLLNGVQFASGKRRYGYYGLGE